MIIRLDDFESLKLTRMYGYWRDGVKPVALESEWSVSRQDQTPPGKQVGTGLQLTLGVYLAQPNPDEFPIGMGRHLQPLLLDLVNPEYVPA